MQKKLLKIITRISALAVVFFVNLTSAHAQAPTLLPSRGDLVEKIQNGTMGFEDIPLFIGHAIKFVLEISGAVAVIMIIYGGLQYVIAAAVPEKKESAKTTIKHALMGLAIAVLAWVIVDTFINVVAIAPMEGPSEPGDYNIPEPGADTFT